MKVTDNIPELDFLKESFKERHGFVILFNWNYVFDMKYLEKIVGDLNRLEIAATSPEQVYYNKNTLMVIFPENSTFDYPRMVGELDYVSNCLKFLSNNSWSFRYSFLAELLNN